MGKAHRGSDNAPPPLRPCDRSCRMFFEEAMKQTEASAGPSGADDPLESPMESPDRNTGGNGEGFGESDDDDGEAKFPFSPSPVLEQRSTQLERGLSAEDEST